ncbi:MAG: hypothetical protein MI684_02545 [Chlorobiales bacterium]|nr:hypothetical protein [Chlorobiales bacterium]
MISLTLLPSGRQRLAISTVVFFFCLGVPGRFMLYALFGKGVFSDKLKSR